MVVGVVDFSGGLGQGRVLVLRNLTGTFCIHGFTYIHGLAVHSLLTNTHS